MCSSSSLSLSGSSSSSSSSSSHSSSATHLHHVFHYNCRPFTHSMTNRTPHRYRRDNLQQDVPAVLPPSPVDHGQGVRVLPVPPGLVLVPPRRLLRPLRERAQEGGSRPFDSTRFPVRPELALPLNPCPLGWLQGQEDKVCIHL